MKGLGSRRVLGLGVKGLGLRISVWEVVPFWFLKLFKRIPTPSLGFQNVMLYEVLRIYRNLQKDLRACLRLEGVLRCAGRLL